MQTIEVSIDVMWEFVCKQVSQEEFVKRWKDSSKKPSGPNGWKIKAIKEDPPMQWDVSVLSHAILNCKDLKLDKSQKKSVENLRDIRNTKLFHRRAAQIDFEEYLEVLSESVESYKGLLDEDRLFYVQRLEDINNREI